MWHRIADFILRYRITLLVGIGVLTVVMGYYGRKPEILQEFVKVVPEDDPDYRQYVAFKQQFGEDGNAIIIGLEGKNLFSVATLDSLFRLSKTLEQVPDVERVLNMTQVFALQNDTLNHRFALQPVMRGPISTQAEADSVRRTLLNLPFYRGLLFNQGLTGTVITLNLSRHAITSARKVDLLKTVTAQVNAAIAPLGLKAHFSGVPYIRNYISHRVGLELQRFMLLAVLLTAIALFIFYRSWYAVVFPLILLLVSSICTLGLVGILGYKLSLLTALLPPIIIILGIPSSIYMLLEYHEEFVHTGDKIVAMRNMIHKLGLVTFMINANTAFGFLTLYFTNVTTLKEFGLLAFLATLLTYVITIILIPGVFSLLPPPTEKRLKHLNSRVITWFIEGVVTQVMKHKRLIYATTIVLTLFAVWGLTRLQAVTYMVDDLPRKDPINVDLKYLEKNYKGVMPFEIVVDTKRRQGIKKIATLRLMEEAQARLAAYPEISRTLSIADALKFSRQAFFGGDSSQYQLPTNDELLALSDYNASSLNMQGAKQSVLANLVDKDYSKARITGFVKDIGSVQMPLLMDSIRKDLQVVFNGDSTQAKNPHKVDFTLTGTTLIFLKANDYLINNLVWSLVATFIIIGLQMLLLFNSFRIMLISMIPNIIPLALTAGLMGFIGIILKPSTALIYEIAFGVAIDNSIHYLAIYRLRRKKGLARQPAVVESLRSAGMSIIYTSIVLFAGFVIFTTSDFDSSRALGLLTSITLFIALFSNLLLMPVLLIDFDTVAFKGRKALIDEEGEDPAGLIHVKP